MKEIPASPQVSDQKGLPEGCFHCGTAIMKEIRMKSITRVLNLILEMEQNLLYQLLQVPTLQAYIAMAPLSSLP